MKGFILQLMLIFFWANGNAQELVRVFGGLNLTNVDAHRIINTTGEDSTGTTPDNFLLPILGVDIQFKISDKSKLLTGVGVDWMGAKNFTHGLSGSINIDNDLKLGYIRVPIEYQLNLFNNFFIFGGVSVNYNFRKTAGFFIAYPDGSSESYYKPWHIGLLGGIRYDISRLSFVVNYHYGLTKLYDSKDLDPEYHVYGNLNGFQFSVGYLFE